METARFTTATIRLERNGRGYDVAGFHPPSNFEAAALWNSNLSDFLENSKHFFEPDEGSSSRALVTKSGYLRGIARTNAFDRRQRVAESGRTQLRAARASSWKLSRWKHYGLERKLNAAIASTGTASR